MKFNKRIIVILLAMSLTATALYAQTPAVNDDKLLAVRRAYFTTTGQQWDDASPDAQAKFMKQFELREKARIRMDEQRKRQTDREDQAKLRQKKSEQRQIDQLEKNYLRKKREEERELREEKRKRNQKMAEMKRRMQRQKAKNH